MPDFFDIYPMVVCEVVAGFAVFLRMHKFWRVEMLEKMQLRTETSEAELKLLKAQLNPHFLFNTLNNLYTLILKRSPRAPAMLLQLTAILDHVLQQGHSSEVPLRQETAFCRDYVELEKERYGDRLHIDVDFTTDADHRTVFPMLFQPLIENAFKHGASQQLGKVWIDIRLSIDGDRLSFRVINSTICPAQTAKPDGIGISNIRRRLQLLYPGRHNFMREQGETRHAVWLTIDLPPEQPIFNALPLGDEVLAPSLP
jgi:LytS/YehU family sensor histidine kinase